MARRVLSIIGAAAVLTALSSPLYAQEEDERAIPWSQFGAVMQRVGFTEVRIRYNRPVARGREVFGGVVKWERIWNPGADSATTIDFTGDVVIEGHALPGGKYTLWVIPKAEGPWTVIFNSRTGIYHTPYPGEEHDVLRLDVEPVKGDHMEVLAFYFPFVEQNEGVLRLHWGNTIIPLAIETPFDP